MYVQLPAHVLKRFIHYLAHFVEIRPIVVTTTKIGLILQDDP